MRARVFWDELVRQRCCKVNSLRAASARSRSCYCSSSAGMRWLAAAAVTPDLAIRKTHTAAPRFFFSSGCLDTPPGFQFSPLQPGLVLRVNHDADAIIFDVDNCMAKFHGYMRHPDRNAAACASASWLASLYTCLRTLRPQSPSDHTLRYHLNPPIVITPMIHIAMNAFTTDRHRCIQHALRASANGCARYICSCDACRELSHTCFPGSICEHVCILRIPKPYST